MAQAQATIIVEYQATDAATAEAALTRLIGDLRKSLIFGSAPSVPTGVSQDSVTITVIAKTIDGN